MSRLAACALLVVIGAQLAAAYPSYFQRVRNTKLYCVLRGDHAPLPGDGACRRHKNRVAFRFACHRAGGGALHGAPKAAIRRARRPRQ